MKKGSKHSIETRKRISLGLMGKTTGKNRKMPPQTEEHKQKIREANKKAWDNPKMRALAKEAGKKSWGNLTSQKREERINKIKEGLKKINFSEYLSNRDNPHLKDPEFIKKQTLRKSKQFKGEGNPFFGKKHTIESRIKVSITKKNSPAYHAIGKHLIMDEERNIQNEFIFSSTSFIS